MIGKETKCAYLTNTKVEQDLCDTKIKLGIKGILEYIEEGGRRKEIVRTNLQTLQGRHQTYNYVGTFPQSGPFQWR
jgi:hypothetical protein